MSDRFDLRPLIHGLREGLKNRRTDAGNETPDLRTRLVLFGAPGLVLLLMLTFRVELTNAEQLLAGAALLSGALIGAFAQIVSWRERILTRNRPAEHIKVRALNEAGAHVLVSLVTSVIVTVAVFILANLDTHGAPGALHILAVALSAVSASSFAYIALSLIIVANLLWDAFQREEVDIGEQNLPEHPRHD